MENITLSQILYAIVGTMGEIKIPYSKMFEYDGKEKGLIMTYDESTDSFIFKLGDKNG